MTTPPALIPGLTPTNKVPGFYGAIQLGVGGGSASAIPNVCQLIGTKGAAGIATVDVDNVNIRSPEDADLYFQAGFELARQCYAALKIKGVNLWASAASEAGSAAAALATITIDGTWTTSGSLTLWIDGVLLSLGILATDTPTTVAAAIATLVTNLPRLPVTAASASGSGTTFVTTLTRKSKGLRGRWGSLFQDKSLIPSGMTCLIAGGASMTGGGVHFSTAGTGTETPTAEIANLYAGRAKYMALAQNDLTTIVAANMWRDTVDAKAGATEGRVQLVTTATNDTYANAIALSSGINDGDFGTLWGYNFRSHPSEIAAVFAAIRQVTEASYPGASYDGVELPGIVGPMAMADVPSVATQETALNNGLTPLVWGTDGKARVVRAITTRCLVNSLPNYATLDVSDAAVPVFVRDDLEIKWAALKLANPVSEDDDPTGKEPPPGVLTPTRARQWATNELRKYEAGINGGPPLIVDVDNHLPSAGWDAGPRRIILLVPEQVAAPTHQLGILFQQISPLSAGR